MALTIQDIHAAADQLQEQGVKPTLAEVRKALGGGSFTTISDAMQSWKREQQEEQGGGGAAGACGTGGAARGGEAS